MKNKTNSHRLNDILNNKTFGSSELVQELNQYFISSIIRQFSITSDFKAIKNKLSHFEIINSYLKELEQKIKMKNNLVLIEFLQNYSKNELMKTEMIFNKIFPYLKDKSNVITFSRSGTVLKVL